MGTREVTLVFSVLVCVLDILLRRIKKGKNMKLLAES